MTRIGSRTTLARYPNLLPNGDWQFMHAGAGGAKSFEQPLLKHGPKVMSWAKEEAPYAHGYWAWDWADGILKMTGITEKAGKITVATAGDAGAGKKNARWASPSVVPMCC